MIPLFILATAAAAPAPDAAVFDDCAARTQTDPAQALALASDWQLRGGGMLARQCEGLAYVAQKRWQPAATAFEAAARTAERESDGRAAALWVQAGNAALAGGDPATARKYFDASLARGLLTGEALGEAYLDRGRALAALGALRAARTDLDRATTLVPADPLGWLLSATLARRMNDLPHALTDITEAARRSPDDAAVAYEAGNIAALAGHDDAARTAWMAAIRLSPTGSAGRASADSLARLGPPR